jgi:DNA-binding CsgD family transcriptional regulator
MEAVTDRTTLFSDTIALIYETHIGDTKRDAMKSALCALLGADELVFTATKNSQTRANTYRAKSKSAAAGNGELQKNGRQPLFAKQTVGHTLSLDIVDRGYDKLKLRVMRNPDRVPFTEHDLEWLSLLRPHLRNAEFVKTLMPEGVLGCAAGNHLVLSKAEGLVITTVDGEIEWLNPTAQHILTAEQGLMCVNGRLRAARAFETTRLELQIREAAAGRSGVMLVSHASMWLPYGLVFVSLDFDTKLAAPVSSAHEDRFVLVTIRDMQRHVDVITKRLAELFGLSEAEQRIGALLLSGFSLQTSAAMMGKSLTTVKKQLRSMLTKTGTHSQAELLSTFLSVPSLL